MPQEEELEAAAAAALFFLSSSYSASSVGNSYLHTGHEFLDPNHEAFDAGCTSRRPPLSVSTSFAHRLDSQYILLLQARPIEAQLSGPQMVQRRACSSATDWE